MSVAVVDSGTANLASVAAALQRLGVAADITSDAQKIISASHIILPGVGSAGAAMEKLRSKNLIGVLRELTQPILGICLGMQLLFTRSQESSGIDCLEIIKGEVQLLPAKPDLPVPHMGWNQITATARNHPLLRNMADNSFVYFVHSYAAPVGTTTLASCDYGVPFAAVVGHKNFFGCQFHPERSGKIGAQILQNFLDM